MGKLDEIDPSAEGDGRGEGSPRRGAPALVWIFVILSVVLASGLGVLGWYALGLGARLDTLEGEKTALAQELAGLTQETRAETARLGERLQVLEARLPGLEERVGRTGESLETFRKEVRVAGAEADRKLAALAEQLDLKEGGLKQGLENVRTDLDRTRQDADLDRKAAEKRVAQVTDDFNYIKEELGKKAEKSYLKFLQRDLEKRIDGVAGEVTQVRTDLETRIAAAEERVTKRVDDLDGSLKTTVVKTVEEATKMDFVPTAEEGK